MKLSGEAFGAGSLGVNPDVISTIAKEIAAAAQDVEVAIVVGGGNFFRGALAASLRAQYNVGAWTLAPLVIRHADDSTVGYICFRYHTVCS